MTRAGPGRPWALAPPLAAAVTIAALGTGAARAQEAPEGLQDAASIGVSIGSGARALGMGGAFIAVADDATASSWNPAGLAILRKPEASIVWKAREEQTLDFAPTVNDYTEATVSPAEGVVAGYRFRGEYHGEVQSFSTHALDFASVTYPFRVGKLKLVPQVNYQRAIDQGLSGGTRRPGVESARDEYRYEEAGGYLYQDRSTGTSSLEFDQEASGGIDLWAASLAVSPHPRIFFGVSANWWRNGSPSRAVIVGESQGCFHSEDSEGETEDSCLLGRSRETEAVETRFRGFNVNLGVLFQATSQIRLGLVYKTPFSMTLETSTTSSREENSRVLPNAEAVDATTETVQEAGRVGWPASIGLGVAFTPRDTLTFAFDVTLSRWSGADYSFRSQRFVFNPRLDPDGTVGSEESATDEQRRLLWPTLLAPPGVARDAADPARERRQRDTYQARLGVEYLFMARKGIIVPLRAGGFLDRQYFTDARGRDVRNWGWTIGTGFVWSNLSLDLAYVRQSLQYSLDYDISASSGAGSIHDLQTSLRDDRFSSDRLYASAIVRF